jgi:hypothetical protein
VSHVCRREITGGGQTVVRGGLRVIGDWNIVAIRTFPKRLRIASWFQFKSGVSSSVSS